MNINRIGQFSMKGLGTSLRRRMRSGWSYILDWLFVWGGLGWGILALVLLLLGDVLLLLSFVSFLASWFLSWRVFIFLLVSLTIFGWGSSFWILLLVSLGLLVLAWSLSSERHWLTVSHWLLVHLHLHLLLIHHVWWHNINVEVVVHTNHWSWGSHVFVWVESTKTTRKSSQISKRSDLNHLVLLEIWVKLRWRDVGTALVVIFVITVVTSLVVMMVLHLLWHWRKSDTFWEIWEWVNELSSLFFTVEEWAAITEFAFTFSHKVLAWFGLIVWVDSSKSSFTKVLWEWLNSKEISIKN